jgi:hypothetical protein
MPVNSIVLGSPLLSAIAAMAAVLVLGDFGSTFFYHVPQHVWGKIHLRTHHDRRRSYWDHAVLSRDPQILLDGFLGSVPYIVLAIALFPVSVIGALLGLFLGQMHVWWRHTCEIGWVSPPWLVRVARATHIVLPEDHNLHHRDPEIEFGDLFRFYDAPARATIKFLRAGTRALSPRARKSASLFRIRKMKTGFGKRRVLKQQKSLS